MKKTLVIEQIEGTEEIKKSLQLTAEEPGETQEFLMAIKVWDFQNVISELSSHLRSKIKYPPEGASEDTVAAYQQIREHLWQLINEAGLGEFF
jgi:hypothetical protein